MKTFNEYIERSVKGVLKSPWRLHRKPLGEVIGRLEGRFFALAKPGNWLAEQSANDARKASYLLEELKKKLHEEFFAALDELGITVHRTVEEVHGKFITHDRIFCPPSILAMSQEEKEPLSLSGFPRRTKYSKGIDLRDRFGYGYEITNPRVLEFYGLMRNQRIKIDIPEEEFDRIREDLRETYASSRKVYRNGILVTEYLPLTAEQKVKVALHMSKLKELNGKAITTGISFESRGRVRTYNFNAHGINPMGKSYQRSYFKSIDGRSFVEFDSNQDMYQTFGAVFLNEQMLGNTGAINWKGSKDAHSQWVRVIKEVFDVEITRDQAKICGTPIGYMSSLRTGLYRTIEGRDIPSVASTLEAAGVDLDDSALERLEKHLKNDSFFSVLFYLVDIVRDALKDDTEYVKSWRTPDGAPWFYSKVATGVIVDAPDGGTKRIARRYSIPKGRVGFDRDANFSLWSWSIDEDFKRSAALAAMNQSIDGWKQREVTLALAKAGIPNVGVHDAYITLPEAKPIIVKTLNECNYRLATEPELYFSMLEGLVPEHARPWLRSQLEDLRKFSMSQGRVIDPKRILKATFPISLG